MISLSDLLLVFTPIKYYEVLNMRVTQQEIAKAAGVSQRAVASVVGCVRKGRGPKVGAATRERILKVARELGYRPQRQAQLLRGVKSGTIGIIKSITLHQASVERVYHTSLAIHAAGYGLVAQELLWSKPGDFQSAVNLLLDARVEGILLNVGGNHGVFTHFDPSQLHVPVVCMGGMMLPGCPSVASDYRQSMRDLVRHLIALGHRRLAFEVALHPEEGDTPPITSTQIRLAGFREACAQAGLSEDDIRVIWQPNRQGSFDAFEPGRRSAKTFLEEGGRRFDALLCQNDLRATGAMKYFLENRVDIPGDLAMTGFDNSALCRQLPVALTSIAQPVAQIANLAVDILVGLIRGEERDEAMEETVLLPCELVVRDSCGAIRKPVPDPL